MGKQTRTYTWHESISGWEAARIGYARQQAAAAAARARAAPLEAHGPIAPAPPKYDAVVNGLWNGAPRLILAAPAKSAPQTMASAPVVTEPWRDWEFDEAGPTGRRRGRWP